MLAGHVSTCVYYAWHDVLQFSSVCSLGSSSNLKQVEDQYLFVRVFSLHHHFFLGCTWPVTRAFSFCLALVNMNNNKKQKKK